MQIGEYVKPAAVLLIICAIISGALAATYGVTKDIIAESEVRKADETRFEVLRQADVFEQIEDVEIISPEGAKGASSVVTGVYEGRTNDGVRAGYVVSVTSKGYGGDIDVMVGIGADMVISAVRVVRQTETPGLGSKAETPGFYTQYDNKKNSDAPLKVVRGTSLGAGEISAISGATITSEAVTAAVNAAITTVAAIHAPSVTK